MIILVGIVTLIVGAILAAPYTFLASGNNAQFWWTVFLGPGGALVLVVFIGLALSKKVRPRATITVATWLLLPILMNGASAILKQFGYEAASAWFFKYRYPSIYLTLAAAVCIFIFLLFIPAKRKQMRIAHKRVLR